jgi:hypothetical protein
MILILPCAGESSRFPGLRPKWMLTQPNGNLMVCDAIAKIDLKNVEKIVLVALRKHIKDFKDSIIDAFKKANIKKSVEIFELSQKTKSQPETVSEYLKTLSEDTPFFIKDCDGQFECEIKPKNQIITADVSLIKGLNVGTKSYCNVNDLGMVTTIVEKQVISRNFCAGGYSFASSKKFLSSYEKIKSYDNLYVSHIIDHMMLFDNESFNNKTCSTYEDWGTVEDWLAYKSTFATFFVDIDGVLVKNSSEFMDPRWGQSKPLTENVEYFKRLKSTGRIQLILTTARTEKFSADTEKQLKDIGIDYDKILYGMLHAKRIIINDHSNSNPYPSCEAFSVQRDDDNLKNLRITK